MEINQATQTLVTTFDELKTKQADPMDVAYFEQTMAQPVKGLERSILDNLSEMNVQIVEAKQNVNAQLAAPGDNPSNLMQIQWSYMQLMMQQELIAKGVGKATQNVETLLKTQ